MPTDTDKNADSLFSDEQQEKLNAILAKEKQAAERKAQRELDKLKAQLAEREAELEEARTKVQATTDGETDLRKRMEALERTNQTLAENLKREAEARKATERDRLIDEALTRAGCIDLKAGRRFYAPDIVEEDGLGFRLKMDDGTVVPVADGITRSLPDYLKASTMRSGGSGAVSSGARSSEPSKIEAAKSELEAAKATLKANPSSNTAMVQVSMAQKKLTALEAEATAGSKG